LSTVGVNRRSLLAIPEIDEVADVRTDRLDVKAGPGARLECGTDQDGCQAAPAQLRVDLSVRERDRVDVAVVVGDADQGAVDAEFEAFALRVVGDDGLRTRQVGSAGHATFLRIDVSPVPPVGIEPTLRPF
jgi:hypothetical protein